MMMNRRRNRKREKRVGKNEQWKQSDSCVQQKKATRDLNFSTSLYIPYNAFSFFCALYPKLSKKIFESSLNPANTNKWTTTFRAQHTAQRAMVLFIILHVVFDSLSCTRSFLSQSRAFSQTAINHFYIRNVLIMIIKPCE